MTLSTTTQLELHRMMMLIRLFEEALEEMFSRGLLHGTMHLSIGQEATAAGACLALQKDDLITSTHRGHGHCLAKGAEPYKMFAELLGREDGYCRGRGGSMHIADLSNGNLGANGIVAGSLTISVGAALSFQMQKKDNIILCFFGDGAVNEGSFHEALNLASLWSLPVLFLCENNQYMMLKLFMKTYLILRIKFYRLGAQNLLKQLHIDIEDTQNLIETYTEQVMKLSIGKKKKTL